MLKEKEKKKDSLSVRKEKEAKIIREKSSEFKLKTIEDLLISGELPPEVFEELAAYQEKFDKSQIFCKITLLRSALTFIHSYYDNREIAELEIVETCNGFVVTLYYMELIDDIPNPTIDDLICAEEAVALVVNLYENARKKNI